MRPPQSCRPLLIGAIAGCLWSAQASAQSVATVPPLDGYQHSGIRFEIRASVRANPVAPEARKTYDRASASLTLKLRISAHASESSFYGVASREFSTFPVVDGSPELGIWQESRCHQRRGLPKATVVAIDGVIARDDLQTRIEARPRQLGRLLPADEMGQGIQLPVSERRGAVMAYRSRSRLSQLLVDVRIYAFDCDLLAEAAPPH